MSDIVSTVIALCEGMPDDASLLLPPFFHTVKLGALRAQVASGALVPVCEDGGDACLSS